MQFPVVGRSHQNFDCDQLRLFTGLLSFYFRPG